MECNDLIIKAASEGNKDAFRSIVEAYQTIVFAICINILKDYHEAENAAQETFLKVYSSLHTYEYKGFKTWISRIATNKAIDVKRKLQKDTYKVVSLEDNIDPSYYLSPTQERLIEDEFIKAEDTKRIYAMCLSLPEIYGIIIKKYYLQSKSYDEIAIEEGISVKTVESRLYRARKKLKDNWEEGG
jgi:RNA polymerase sigma factor (sigma-70 family)